MATLLTLAKADTGPLVVTVSHTTMGASGLTPYLTANGGRMWFMAKFDSSDPDVQSNGIISGYVFKKDLTNGITVTTVGNNTTTDGVVSIVLQPADTTTALLYDFPITLFCSLKGATADNPNLEYTIKGRFDDPIYLTVGASPTSKVS